MNAVDFIRQSVFCTSKKYAQIRPVVDKVITDSLNESDLDECVDAIAPLGASTRIEALSEGGPSSSPSAPPVTSPGPTSAKVKAIKRISDTRNIALIKQSPPIDLTGGLNIFYGHNGDGKTTLYRAISNCLGLAEHPLDNIAVGGTQRPQAHLVVEDMEGNGFDLAWPSDKPTHLDPIRLFDASICLALVRDDQDTTFSLAHLKQEYFAFLGNALKILAMKVDERSRLIAERLQSSVTAMQTAAPKLGDLFSSLTNAHLENAAISEDERKSLRELEANLESLERNELPHRITMLANDISHLDEILSSLGQSTNDPDGNILDWGLTCTQSFFEGANNLITKYQRDSGALVERTSALASSVTEEWTKNPLWQSFVAAALGFVRSLEPGEQKIYREQKCPYCQQLLSSTAQQLLLAYNDLLGAAKESLDRTHAEITRALSEAQQRADRLKVIPYKEALISEEGKCLRGDEVFQLARILGVVNQLTTSLATKSPVTIAPQESENVAVAFSHYRQWRRALVVQKNSYETTLKNKTEEANKLRLRIEPLKIRELLVDNRSILRECLSLRQRAAKLAGFREFLTEAKRQESTLATQFSSQMTIQEFQKVLDREYDSLGFQKPGRFTLGCKTSAGATKRVYTIGDRRFREILSEGEQKQHALADFFAQIELERYGGLVIFDDPVTSLDELNTERVARRIVDLNAKHGNQVIVFTHNVFFLNSLVEITHNDKVIHLSKSGDEIVVLPNAQLGSESALKRTKNQIQERMKIVAQTHQPPEDALRSVYDLLSRYIETAVETSLLKDVVGRYRPNIRIQSLPRIRWNDGVVNKLVELYNRTSRKGTRHSQPPSVPPPTKTDCLADTNEILDLVGAL